MMTVLAIGGLAALMSLSAAADTMNMDQKKYAAFKSFADKRLRETKVPGFGLGIIKDGKVIFAGGFGTRDLNTGEPINSQTAYLIGSATKAFTTATIAMLDQDGILDWDSTVRTYLPWFSFKDNEYVSSHVTLRDLASHRTGLALTEWQGDTPELGLYSSEPREKLVKSIRNYPLSAGLREKFQYNSAMFMTLGHVISKATKNQYEDVVMQRIAKPLGMKSTIWSDLSGPNPPFAGNIAYPHAIENGEASRIDFLFEGPAIHPSGTLTSTIDDMLKWVTFHLQKGEYNGKRLLSEENHDALVTPNMVVGYNASLSRTRTPAWPEMYGLGWFLGTYNGQRAVHHSGTSTGTITRTLFMPDKNFAVVTFINAENAPNPLQNEIVLFAIDLYKDDLLEMQADLK
jgi:CubicO group peptidase (beta-lactamase class C family)